MIGIILVGGSGERFKPITNFIPKCMIPLNGIPILDYNIRMLKEAKVRHIYILAGAHGEYIRYYYRYNTDVEVFIESPPMGTAGGLKYLLDNNHDYIILNGDSIYDLNIKEMYKFHKDRGTKVTIAASKVEDARSFGLLEIDKGGHVLRFMEKPKTKISGIVSTGLYIVSGKLNIDDGYQMLETNVFPELVAKNEISAFTKASWLPIDNPELFFKAEKVIK